MKKIQDFFLEGKLLSYKHGEIILRPGDTPSGIYYIVKGYVKVYSLNEEGEERIHIIYKQDEIFPLIWLFSGVLKNVFYEAYQDAALRRVSKDEFLVFIQSHSDLMMEMIQRLISIFNVYADRIENLELSKAYPRLISRILFLAKRFGVQTEEGMVIPVPIGHKELANSVAMTRETASRVIEKLEKKSLLFYKNKLIVIPDKNALEQELIDNFEHFSV